MLLLCVADTATCWCRVWPLQLYLLHQISGLVSGYTSDPAKLEPFIVKGFGMFDKDGSGR
jgi:hypothetical protein